MAPDSSPLQNTSSIDWKWKSSQQQEASLFVLFSCCMIKMDRRKKSAWQSWPSTQLILWEDRQDIHRWVQLLPWFALPKVAACQTFEYLWERLARSCCLPNVIYSLLRAELAFGSFMHLLRSELGSGLRCVLTLAIAAPSSQIKAKIRLLKIDNCDNGYTLMKEDFAS